MIKFVKSKGILILDRIEKANGKVKLRILLIRINFYNLSIDSYSLLHKSFIFIANSHIY
jgi:hypothetical protein